MSSSRDGDFQFSLGMITLDDLSEEGEVVTETDPFIEDTGWEKFHRKLKVVRVFCGSVVNHVRVQQAVVLMITINAIMMGIGTFDYVNLNPRVNKAFETSDLVFLVIFTIELVMQFLYLGMAIFLDPWLVFDFVVIFTSWSFSSLQIIRTFRIFRALRLVTRIKVMKNLVLAVFSVFPKMAAIGALLLVMSYIFAVMFTTLFKDLYDDNLTDANYFGRLDHTIFTLFQMMTLDNWADIARQVIAVYWWAWIPLLTFVTISGFIVVNLIIAVICDAVSSLQDDVKAKIHGTFAESDDDSHETLSLPIRDRVEVIEKQFDELQRLQEQTMENLEVLTRKLQSRNLNRVKEGNKRSEK